MGFLDSFLSGKKEQLDKGLEKSKENFFSKLGKAIAGKSTVDDDVLDNLEEILVSSDVGIQTTVKIIDRIKARVARDKYLGTAELDRILKEEVAALLVETDSTDRPFALPENHKPYVLMVVGVNGVGKTTTIGKLAAQYIKNGKKVVLGAGDTFRAAAVDQLKRWGERTGATVISKGMNTDPSAVAYETIEAGVKENADIIILDTAGRLHTKVNLMAELSKIKRVMQKVVADAPHDVMLVLDGSTGQNAVIQAREFTKATEVTCLAITKLDGTAKGGVVIGISDEFNVPVRFIGVGEKAEDLQPFDRHAFVEALFKR
ncbi:MAG: signal recognition particle-docking protein FtsY [Cyclobacteriaceae bacterium]|jgi:fused signal recognition particle receptor|nr:signal recognition particle-docking protein FtsY [Cyclobacteriaceae bacterium]